MTNKQNAPLSYRQAGVDIDAGEALVERIKPLAAATMREGVLTGLGGFGALFEIPKRYQEPVLVSGTDGVGTKLRLAFDWQRHHTVGIDLVAMSVNDILVQGAEPLFFLDYFACGKLSVDTAEAVVSGIAQGCSQAGCALIGGETAEMPGMYPEGEYDLAGFAVGVVEKSRLITGATIAEGDVLLGLASSGPHSNGYSLIRKIIERAGVSGEALLSEVLARAGINADTRAGDDTGVGDGSGSGANVTLADALMAPTRIYVKPVLAAIQTYGQAIKGLAHITGGGLTENLPRILPEGLAAQIHQNEWQLPLLFQWLQAQGQVETEEMYRVFNCGLGMVMVVAADQAQAVADQLRDAGETVYTLGQVVAQADDASQVQIGV